MQMKRQDGELSGDERGRTVFGIAQKSSGLDTITTCYAAGAAFAMAQKINALSLGDVALKKYRYPERITRSGGSGIGVSVYGFHTDVG